MAGLVAEKLGDVEEGFTPDAAEVDELGLTTEERQQFDGMKEADKGLPEATESDEPEVASEGVPDAQKPTLEAPPAPVEAKQKAPEPEPEDDEPDQVTRDPKTGKEQRTISYGKHQRLLKKERETAEALRAQQQEARVNQARLAERLDILNQALTTQPAPQPRTAQEEEYYRQQQIAENPLLEDTIDPNVDPGGAIAQIQRRQIFMANLSYQQQEATEEQLADQQMVRDFSRDTQMYSQTAEGQHFFGAEGAYQFLKNSRLTEMGLSYFDKNAADPNEQFTPQEIQKLVNDFNVEERWLVGNALKNGKSPAKAIMNHAKARGWRPPQPQAQAAPAAVPTAPSARRGTTAASSPTPAARSAVAQIQAEQAGAAASRSLSDGGGAPPAEPLSYETLLNMNDEEFGMYIDNLPKPKLDAMMGREFPARR